MNVLLVNANREKTPVPAMPLGLCAVASSASAAGFHVVVADLCFSSNPERRLRKLIQFNQPDVVGISVHNIDNADSVSTKWYLPSVRRLVEACRSETGVPVVVGGPAVTTAPKAVLSYLGADYAVAGDGEESFVRLLRALERKLYAAAIPGVIARDSQNGALESVAHIRNLDSLPRAQIFRWLGLGHYADCDASFPVQTKRGCTFKCDYCNYAQIEGHEYRLRSPQLVVDEIEELLSIHPGRSIEIVDNAFNCPEDHALKICEELVRRRVDVSLQASDFNPMSSSPKLLSAMERAGFSAIAIAVDSASDTALQNLNKGFTALDVHRAAERLKATDMLRMWMFLFGGPGETEETARETIDFIQHHLTSHDLVYITHGVRIYPGTGMQRRAVKDGIVAADDELLSPKFYISPELSLGRLRQMMRYSDFPSANVVFASDANRASLPTLQRLLSFFRVAPPYWRHTPLPNRVKRIPQL
jgi:radical SAM superfamily enzyme YgiQ (UPF0313 family)